MNKPKLVRITTVPISLEKLLEGQLGFMKDHFDVTAISADKESLESYGKNEGVATHHLELTRKITPYQDAKAVYQLFRYLKQTKPVIIHSHTPKAGIVGMLAARLAGVPLRLHTVAGLPLMEAKGIKRTILNFVEKLTYRCATNVYPNSQGLFDFIVSEKLATKQKLKILGKGSSNGIDTTYFDPSLFTNEDRSKIRKKLGIPENNFVYVFVGRLVKDKGINELIEAFLIFQKEKKNVSLLLVGPLESDLDPLKAETLGAIEVNSNIISVGYQKDVRPYFALSDALVFPSYREGFPNVVLQSAAMELPAIVSDINGCNEIITHGENGLIVPSKSVNALFIAMLDLVNNKTMYLEMKKIARIRIMEKYEREEVFKVILAEYRMLLSKL